MKDLTFDDIEAKYPLTDEENAEIDLKVQLIGKLIELRKAHKLTQEQFAELCGVKRSFIARIECNKERSMTIETLIKLADAVGCQVALVPKRT